MQNSWEWYYMGGIKMRENLLFKPKALPNEVSIVELQRLQIEYVVFEFWIGWNKILKNVIFI